ncbi:MAG: two-component sensor histidine kinase [Nevskia sp.]|nr:two-component sensor histidine kinase [Nevskia sp.]
MNSLRMRLALSLWTVLLVVGLISGAVTYVQSRDETNTLLDYQLEEIAGLVAGSAMSGSPPSRISPAVNLDHEAEDDFLVTLRNTQGTVMFASEPDAPLPDFEWLGYRTVRIGKKEYRAFSATSSNKGRIVVAQQTVTRKEVARDAAMTALLPLALLIPMLGFAIYWVIGRQLRSVRDAAQEVSGRSPFDAGSLAVVRLPTEVQPLINEINRLLVRQRSAVQREQMFLADAAHALRTPLTALQLQVDILEGSTDASENEKRRHELRRGILRATRLNDHLLALARGQQMRELTVGRIDLDTAMTEIFDFYSPLAESKSIEITHDLNSRCAVRGDVRHLMLIVGNILDNAIRYTPVGGKIAVVTEVMGKSARIEVFDEGPGLAESELEVVFERFRRGDGDETQGTGLGLAVVHSTAELLGGMAWLERRGDRSGLRAFVELPCLEGVDK